MLGWWREETRSDLDLLRFLIEEWDKSVGGL